jgi:hypothetical protein
MTTRLYHVVVMNERTGVKVRLSASPVTHSEGCTWLSKVTSFAWRRKFLEEV